MPVKMISPKHAMTAAGTPTAKKFLNFGFVATVRTANIILWSTFFVKANVTDVSLDETVTV